MDAPDDVTRSLTLDLADGVTLRLPRARLLVELGEDEGDERALGEWPLTLGRGKDAGFRLSDSTVSREHARLVPVHRGWVVEDMGSRSGTLVNGEKVDKHRLADGDRVRIGATELVFRHGLDELHAPAVEGEEFHGLLARAPAMRKVFGLVRKVAPLEFPVLVHGETGTGKEALARALHDLGPNPSGPFVTVDCTLLAGEHLRSELFGHEKGAFTGASADRPGAFRRADGGTLFLDEIGELPLDLQPALLRVLEQGTVSPLGSEQHHQVRVRVVAATHRDLRARVETGDFRQDLLYRLSAVVLTVPPLRAREGDVTFLAERFLAEGQSLSPDARDRLEAHDWPGNVRELRQAVEVAAQLTADGLVRAKDLNLVTAGATPALAVPTPSPDIVVEPAALAAEDAQVAAPPTPAPEAPPEAEAEAPPAAEAGPTPPEGLTLLEEAEFHAIVKALKQTGGSQQEAADLLGVNRSTLYRKLRRFGLK
jgi:DNA-binding NtrC family response regulator